MDEERNKLLNIKMYDKMLDLLSREGIRQVGSRISDIVCSRDKLSVFDRRVSKAQFIGMTRLEISIRRDALEKYSPQLPSVKT